VRLKACPFRRDFAESVVTQMATLTDIKAVASAGIVVSLPHAAGMQSSLPILQKNYKFSKVFYWGKMMGMKGDYLIAKGIEESSSTMKFFYWCAPREPAARAGAQWRRPATAMVLSCCCRRCRWLPLLPVPAAFPVPVASSHSRCLCFRLRPPRRHANRPCLARLPRSSRAARTASRGRSCPS
jgi:hypothetical protein